MNQWPIPFGSKQEDNDAVVMIDVDGSVEGGHAAEMAILLEESMQVRSVRVTSSFSVWGWVCG